MKKPNNTSLSILNKKYVYYLLIMCLLFVAVVPQRQQIKEGFNLLINADLNWVANAVYYLPFTYFTAAISFQLLSKKRLKLIKTAAVQFSASFTNRLLPGGIGGMGLNVDYLLKSKHSIPEAGSVVAMNSLLSFVGHIILIVVAIISSKSSARMLIENRDIPYWPFFVVAILIIMSLLIIRRHKRFKNKLISISKKMVNSFFDYKDEPLKLCLAMIGTILMTTVYIMIFMACSNAVGLDIGYIQSFIVYTAGVVFGAIALTPGGLGGVEAGTAAGIIVLNGNAPLAISAVILYRLVTFWLPMLPAYLMFWWLRRKRII